MGEGEREGGETKLREMREKSRSERLIAEDKEWREGDGDR